MPLVDGSDEVVTQGLDGLDERCSEYDSLGAKFTKWRAVIKSEIACHLMIVLMQTQSISRLCCNCQSNNMVPIVEPEVLMDGDHPIDLSLMLAQDLFKLLFDALENNGVNIKGTILKPSMVTPGSLSEKVAIREVAEMTVKCSKRIFLQIFPELLFYQEANRA